MTDAPASPLTIDAILEIGFLDASAKQRQRLLNHFAGNATDDAFNWDWTATHFNRMALMSYVTRSVPACAYLEIGCDRNILFDALPISDKTGVDPARGGTHQMTSDAFFAQNTKTFDVIWIDGLHEYQQVHRDLQSAIRVLNPGGWIGLHDFLPNDWLHEHMPRINRAWTGDVWKVGMELAATKGVTARIVQIDHGCALIQADGPDVTLTDLSDQIAHKRFQYLFDNLDKMPERLLWDDAKAWIDSRTRTP